MDLRQHRKMIMIDNYIAYTGSMNMVDPASSNRTPALDNGLI
jgi:phosphatidylserine/phosphatidylglycerophosphate/cardiolipin synthase-like enzyme